ncbi:B3 domain-containing protein REM8-like [Capsicum annuum]|uniref:B3 domain-containing protein REM8-like n=1 Tax=Capsicum annuum TaxID=4072 RepID=UPI001FB0FECA|nr:B3 domain-containing protein REM8-like [Capsicum annuum]
MEIPPKKAHFFKPILPGFKNGLKIPIGFLKYLRGLDHIEHIVLKRAGNKWLVKMNGRRLEDGWEKFVEEHDLQLGDILIFRHEGDMDFDVSIFDSTHCDTEYAEYKQIQEEKDKRVEDENEDDEVVEEEEQEEDDDDDEDDEVYTLDRPFGRSHFEFTIRQYCLSKGFMNMNSLVMCVFTQCRWIPKDFAFANGLINRNKKFGLIIINERQTRSWNLMLHSCKTQAYIADGWRKFSADNCLKEGDRIMFEIVAKGETQIWKFQVVSNAKKPMRKFQENAMEKPKPNVMSSHKDFPDVETAKDMPRGRPRFIYTITASCISKYFLHVPRQFARENGLRDRKCIITIRDEQQRPWVFKLYTATGNTFIAGGWRNFCAANFLMEGDRVMIEMFSKGEQPIFKIYGKANASLQPEEKKPNLDAVRVFTQGKPKPKIKTSSKASSKVEAAYKDTNLSHSHFICTIRPYSLSKYFLFIFSFSFDSVVSINKLDLRESPSLQAEVKMKILDAERMSDKGRRLKTSSMTTPESQVAASTSVDVNSHFISTIKPYTIKNPTLYLPLDFAKSNGLMDKSEMILVDEKQRSWSVWLGRMGHHFGILRGWTQFKKANGVQVGDTYKFELTYNGTIPIVHFHCKYSGKDAVVDGQKETSH